MSLGFERTFEKLLRDIQTGTISNWKIDLRAKNLQKKHIEQLAEVLTDNFHSVKNIMEIDLAYNNLTELPPNILKDCDSLHILNLDNNHLTRLPNLPDRPYALQDFFANNNPLESIPSNYFDDCVSLKAAYLSNTQISDAPYFKDSLGLAWLHLNSNPISKFPEKYFQYLEHLDTLYLHDMHLKVLPDLAACKKLHEVWIDDIKIKQNHVCDTVQLFVCKTTQ